MIKVESERLKFQKKNRSKGFKDYIGEIIAPDILDKEEIKGRT